VTVISVKILVFSLPCEAWREISIRMEGRLHSSKIRSQ